MMQDVVNREGRVACIGVLLTDQEGSQHLRADAAREQEDSIGGRYSIGVGRLRQLLLSTYTTWAIPRQETQILRSENSCGHRLP